MDASGGSGRYQYPPRHDQLPGWARVFVNAYAAFSLHVAARFDVTDIFRIRRFAEPLKLFGERR
jgi:hypothetical protein